MAPEQDSIERQVFIPARPETIFRFLVEPELMARWIGRVQFAAAQEGGLFRLQFTFGEGHTATGIFTEISPRSALPSVSAGKDTTPSLQARRLWRSSCARKPTAPCSSSSTAGFRTLQGPS